MSGRDEKHNRTQRIKFGTRPCERVSLESVWTQIWDGRGGEESGLKPDRERLGTEMGDSMYTCVFGEWGELSRR